MHWESRQDEGYHSSSAQPYPILYCKLCCSINATHIAISDHLCHFEVRQNCSFTSFCPFMDTSTIYKKSLKYAITPEHHAQYVVLLKELEAHKRLESLSII